VSENKKNGVFSRIKSVQSVQFENKSVQSVHFGHPEGIIPMGSVRGRVLLLKVGSGVGYYSSGQV